MRPKNGNWWIWYLGWMLWRFHALIDVHRTPLRTSARRKRWSGIRPIVRPVCDRSWYSRNKSYVLSLQKRSYIFTLQLSYFVFIRKCHDFCLWWRHYDVKCWLEELRKYCNAGHFSFFVPKIQQLITVSISKFFWRNFARLLPNYSPLFPANSILIGWDLAILSRTVYKIAVFFSDTL